MRELNWNIFREGQHTNEKSGELAATVNPSRPLMTSSWRLNSTPASQNISLNGQMVQ